MSENEKINKMLEDYAEGLGDNFDVTDDKGTEELVKDILRLLKTTLEYEYHDYKNKIAVGPKMDLLIDLNAMTEKVKNGTYDNIWKEKK